MRTLLAVIVLFVLWGYHVQAVHDAKVRGSEECQKQITHMMERSFNEQ